MSKKLEQYFDPELATELKSVFKQLMEKDAHRLSFNDIIDENNIFQPAVKHNREVTLKFIQACLLEGSTILNLDHWDTFFNNFKAGQSSLILAEHKSNLDVVIFYYLMKKLSRLEEFDDIAFIAGRKLNEESVTVRLFAEMFNRLVVVPKSETQDANEEQMHEIYKINYAAQQFLKTNLQNYIYLIYPTGTRSRIWEPSSYEGITETINYLEKFDQVIFMSCDGNCMFPMPGVAMESEPLIQDKIVIRFSEPMSVKSFIDNQKKDFYDLKPEGTRQDLKAYITKSITQKIYAQKPVPPTQESWTQIIRTFLENQTKS